MEIANNIVHKLLLYLFRTFLKWLKVYDGWQSTVVGVAHNLLNAGFI